MALLVCIDGTGPYANAEYGNEFAHSFVRKIWWHSPLVDGETKHYSRGPWTPGAETSDLISGGYRFITDRLADEGENPRIYLAGYSRGAAAVVAIAQRLREYNHQHVHAMFLFDCVDRTSGEDCDATWVPGSVRVLMHARRDIRAADSRASFGHSATRVDVAAERYYHRDFVGTHGAIGGVPWSGPRGHHFVQETPPDGSTRITFDRDLECSREVFWWSMPFLRAHGVWDQNSHPTAP